jgi:Xaa-Pro aminopeptidase
MALGFGVRTAFSGYPSAESDRRAWQNAAHERWTCVTRCASGMIRAVCGNRRIQTRYNSGFMVDFSPFIRRRRQLLAALDGGVLVAFAAAPTIRNNDVTHEFRQDSDFYYLTGFDEPDAALVLVGGAAPRSILFVTPRDPEREVWDGVRLGVEGAGSLGVDEARSMGELDELLPRLLIGRASLFARFEAEVLIEPRLARALGTARREGRRGALYPNAVIDSATLIHEMRRQKDSHELSLMERAIAISAEAHVAAMARAEPGLYEYEIEALLRAAFRAQGSERLAYEPIVGSGCNATVLHYVKNQRQMQDGELLLVDAGCEFGYYAADITRTFPVNGRFTPAQLDVYEVVLAAQRAAIERAAPGSTLEHVHEAATRCICEGLVALGVLSGSARDVEAEGRYKPFFMHKTSHYLGMDVHDVGRYFEAGRPRALEPGVVIIYFGANAANVPERYRGIGVRIEDDVLIEPLGARVLSLTVPKDPDDIERACRA